MVLGTNSATGSRGSTLDSESDSSDLDVDDIGTISNSNITNQGTDNSITINKF